MRAADDGPVGFGWRSWEQRRRTGSTGFRGVSGRLGSAEWFAGAGFIAAIATAVVAPVLQWVGVVSPVGVLHAVDPERRHRDRGDRHRWDVYAQLDMGDSWRIGVDPSETTTLVRTGVFGWVRNPIFTTMIAFGFGIALVTPNLVALTATFSVCGPVRSRCGAWPLARLHCRACRC
jgi:hypothetical protein